MNKNCKSTSVSTHKDWPLALERMNRYLQALKLPVSQQSQLLTAVEQKFNSGLISETLTAQALAYLREAIAENDSCFCQYVISEHYGFADARNLQSRSWSMPSMTRSHMVPNTRSSHKPALVPSRPDTQTT